MKVLGSKGERLVSLERFLQDYFQVDLKEGEFVAEIVIPSIGERSVSAFEKFSLTADDWALVNCSVTLTVDDDLSCNEVRIALGGEVGSTPKRAHEMEEWLKGKKLTENLIAEGSGRVRSDIEPISDIRGSADYRQSIAEVLVARTVSKAVRRFGEVSL